MFKLFFFFFKLNFLKGFKYTLFLCVSLFILNKIFHLSQLRNYYPVAFTLIVLTNIGYIQTISNGIAGNLDWIKTLPIKRVTLFKGSYFIRIFNFIFSIVFNFLPLLILYIYLCNENFNKITEIFMGSLNLKELKFSGDGDFFSLQNVLIILVLVTIFHTAFISAQGSIKYRMNTFLQRSHSIKSLGTIRYLIKNALNHKLLSLAILLTIGASFLYLNNLESLFLIFLTFIFGSFIFGYEFNIKKYNLFKKDYNRLLYAHAFCAFLFSFIIFGLTFRDFKSSNSVAKLDATLFMGALSPKLSQKEILGLFENQKDKINLSEVETLLKNHGFKKSIFNIDKDWVTFSNHIKTKKSSHEIHELLSFFTIKSLNEFQLSEILNEFSRVNKGEVRGYDYLTLIQYPQSIETIKKLINSNRSEYTKLGLMFSSYLLDPRLEEEIRKSMFKFKAVDQPFALNVLSYYQRKPLSLNEWEEKPRQAIKTGRSLASLYNLPDPRTVCDNFKLPKNNTEFSQDQLNTISSCIRFKARNSELSVKLKVEKINWLTAKIDQDDFEFIKTVF